MQELTIALGVVAALLSSTAFILYGVQSKIGASSPNAASWGIWAFLATLNAFSFREMTNDTVATLQFFAGSAGCIFTFVYVFIIGRFSRLKQREWAMFALGILATLIWWKFRSATMANMIVLVAFIFSFIPTFDGARRDPFKETPLPWTLWALAFLITTANVVLRDNKSIAFITPVVLFISHGSIAILSSQKRKKLFRQGEQ